MTEKEKLAWELTRLWYIILSHYGQFWMMSKREENEWEQTFTQNNMKKYTKTQLQTEVVKAREYCIQQKLFKED